MDNSKSEQKQLQKEMKVPLDIMTIEPVTYTLVGSTIQTTACFRILSLGMSCLRTEQTSDVLTASIDDYNDWKAEQEMEEARNAQLTDMGLEPTDKITTVLSRENKEKEMGRWTYVYQCTLDRNTGHFSRDGLPYRVLDAFTFRLTKSAEAGAESYMKSQAEQVEEQSKGAVKAVHWFAKLKREANKDLLGLSEIGRPAVIFARSINRVEEMPLSWAEDWPTIKAKALQGRVNKPGVTVEEIVTDSLILNTVTE